MSKKNCVQKHRVEHYSNNTSDASTHERIALEGWSGDLMPIQWCKSRGRSRACHQTIENSWNHVSTLHLANFRVFELLLPRRRPWLSHDLTISILQGLVYSTPLSLHQGVFFRRNRVFEMALNKVLHAPIWNIRNLCILVFFSQALPGFNNK